VPGADKCRANAAIDGGDDDDKKKEKQASKQEDGKGPRKDGGAGTVPRRPRVKLEREKGSCEERELRVPGAGVHTVQ
jgi:hypothetical protein